MTIYGGAASNNGDHLDMLHESPYSQGIAWENENVFWNFDGYNNDIVRYDFGGDHDPGNDDHSDGIIRRYADFTVSRDVNDIVPSHLVLDKNKKWLYIVDYGNKRVMRLDITTGTVGGTPSWGPHETVHEYKKVTGYDFDTVINTGLNKPCGIDIMDNTLIISDYATNEIIFYNISVLPATELYRVAIPNSNGIMGIKIGPDGYIYAVDNGNNRVVKVKPSTPNALNEVEEINTITISPNPTSNSININYGANVIIKKIIISDITGKVINAYPATNKLDVSQLASGQYFITVQTTQQQKVFKISKK